MLQEDKKYTKANKENAIPTREEMYNSLEKRHTKKVQEKLHRAKVAVCGLGGLGSNIAIALARTGVGTLHLIDFDVVDLSNLNRQQYGVCHLNQPKPSALENIIKSFAPYCNIKTHFVKIDENNAFDLLRNEDIICEAFDVPEQKAMLTNAVLTKMPQKILVGASGMAGYNSSNSIVTKRVMKNYYLCGDGVSDIENTCGLMAPRVMLCAAHQANMVIRLILGEYEP